MTILGRFAAATGSAPLAELWPSGLTRHRTASLLVHDELSPRWLTRTGVGDGRALSAQSDARMPTHASGKTADARPSPRDATSSASSSSTSGDATAAPFEGFRFIQSLAGEASGRSASLETVGLWGCAALVGSATTTGALTAWVRSRSKAERDLPPGTHARAAVTAFKALGVASLFTGVAASVVFAGAWGLGIDSASALRRSLRGATRGAIAATGADTLRPQR